MERPGRPLTAKSILLSQRMWQLDRGDKPGPSPGLLGSSSGLLGSSPGLLGSSGLLGATSALLDTEEDFLAGRLANSRCQT